MGPHHSAGGGREHWIAPSSSDTEWDGRLHPSLFDGQLHLPGGGFHTEATLGLLCIQHLYTHLYDSDNVVGFILDQAGGGAGESHSRSDLITDTLHAAREVAVFSAACLLSESSGRFHVRLHGVRLHGTDGVLPDKHCTKWYAYTQAHGISTKACGRWGRQERDGGGLGTTTGWQ